MAEPIARAPHPRLLGRAPGSRGPAAELPPGRGGSRGDRGPPAALRVRPTAPRSVPEVGSYISTRFRLRHQRGQATPGARASGRDSKKLPAAKTRCGLVGSIAMVPCASLVGRWLMLLTAIAVSSKARSITLTQTGYAPSSSKVWSALTTNGEPGGPGRVGVTHSN